MSIIDVIVAYKFIQILSTPWKSMDAYKQGIINDKGTILIPRSQLKTSAQKSAYPSVFYTLCWNIKRILEKVGLGQNIAGFLSALYLLKEKVKEIKTSKEAWDKIQNSAMQMLEERGHAEEFLFLKESTTDTVMYPGEYVVNYKIIVVEEPLTPHGTCLGVPIFKVGDIYTNLLEARARVREDGAVAGAAPANNVGGGAIAGVSPGQEPPGPKGGFKALKKKKRKKQIERDNETINIVGPLNRNQP